MRGSQLHFFWRGRAVRKRFPTGVSMLNHTLYFGVPRRSRRYSCRLDRGAARADFRQQKARL